MQLNLTDVSGIYMNNAFSLSMYNTPVDSEGFIIGAGQLINLEFYTAAPGSEDFHVVGTYHYYDTQAWMDKTTTVKFDAGDLMGGIIYEPFPGYSMPMGTMVQIINDDLDAEEIGLAGPGSTLVVTNQGDGIFKLDVDIYTLQHYHITASWEGPLAEYVKDCPQLPNDSDAELGYTPIMGNYELSLTDASGRYLNNGFSLSLYSTPLDSDGYIFGAGDVANLEFYTAAPGSEDFSVAGTYSYYDTEAWMTNPDDMEKYGAGDLMGGFMYEFFPGFSMPMGTIVNVYDNDGDVIATGLAGPKSELTVEDMGEGYYKITIDFFTMQNAHITGQWVGTLDDCVIDFPVTEGVENVSIEGGKVEYYDLNGIKVDNPVAGKLYISVRNGKASKVIVK